jgi:hypothetical protein
LRVHAVDREQGARFDGHTVGRVDDSSSCEIGDSQVPCVDQGPTCFPRVASIRFSAASGRDGQRNRECRCGDKPEEPVAAGDVVAGVVSA